MLGTTPRWDSSASYRIAASEVTASRSNNLTREFSLLMLASIYLSSNRARQSQKSHTQVYIPAFWRFVETLALVSSLRKRSAKRIESSAAYQQLRKSSQT